MMEGVPVVVSSDPQRQVVAGDASVALLRRVVEGLPRARPGRYVLYLGRPDPATVRAEQDREFELIRSARRAVVLTPGPSLLPPEAERRDPGLGWLRDVWFSAVLGDRVGMALIAPRATAEAEHAWLLTDPDGVRRFLAAVEAELARPDPQLLAV